MQSSDFDTFLAEFRRLAAALERYKSSPTDAAAKADAYFQVLRKYPLQDVLAKADRWLASENKFPTPAQWASVVVRKVVELPVMTDAQAREYRRAESLFYEDAPCSCALCVEAGVSEKPLRFVPEFTEYDTDRKVWDPLGSRVVTAGHWAHGCELQRLYSAQADFWNRVRELGLLTPKQIERTQKLPIQERLARIFAKKPELV